MSPKVSVIIPVFNVEKYIYRCASTLLSQSFTDVEFIFVNDASEDNSISILIQVINAYPSRVVKIIHHEKNKGLPSARNTGLLVAQGKYVIHCDADDFVDENMIEELYNAAELNCADIVWCDYFETLASGDVLRNEPEFMSVKDLVKGILSRNMQYNVWNKLVKKTLYTDYGISFPDGFSMGEDLTMVKLFSHARKIHYHPKAYYHYVRYNDGAMTKKMNQKKIEELRHNLLDLTIYLDCNFPYKYSREINYMLLWSKYRFLLTDGRDNSYNMWAGWFPDSHSYISSLPNANTRVKLLNWFASKNQWWFVWLHYWIVLRGIYPFIHKGIKY